MANANVPIKFEIYKGDELVREEVLAQSPSSRSGSWPLRTCVSTTRPCRACTRVIEATGPDDVQVVDLGSTRGTTGQRRARSPRRGCSPATRSCSATAASSSPSSTRCSPRRPRRPQAWGGGRAARRGGYARAAAGRRTRPPPPAAGLRAASASQRVPAAAVLRAAPSFAGAPGAGAEVEVHDGSRAMEVQTIFRGVVTGTRHLFNPEGKTTHGQGTSMLYAGLAAAVLAIGVVRLHRDRRRRGEDALRAAHRRGGKDAKTFNWKHRSPASGAHRVRRPARRPGAGRTWASSGAARRSTNFIIGSDADADAPVSPEYVPSSSHPLVQRPAPTTSSTSPRA